VQRFVHISRSVAAHYSPARPYFFRKEVGQGNTGTYNQDSCSNKRYCIKSVSLAESVGYNTLEGTFQHNDCFIFNLKEGLPCEKIVSYFISARFAFPGGLFSFCGNTC
jgi:hypothetical protein